MIIWFTSDGSIDDQGFSASYIHSPNVSSGRPVNPNITCTIYIPNDLPKRIPEDPTQSMGDTNSTYYIFN